MKALKEKRISLRSLWRRGLVILSLFALVFASCANSDGDGGSGSDSGGKRSVVSVTILDDPTVKQYMGQEVDLKGLTLDVKYRDGDRKTISYEDEPGKFTTNPRIVTAQYWSPYVMDDYPQKYDLMYDGILADRPIDFAGKVVPIFTDVIRWGYDWDDYKIMNVLGTKDFGLHVTGWEDLAQKTAYVDETKFNFGGLQFEADYLLNYDSVPEKNQSKDSWVPKLERKKVKFSNITWEIRPRYDRAAFEGRGGKNGDGYYDGYVVITAGQDIRYERIWDDWDWQEDWKGISTFLPLEKVYTVKEIKLLVNAETQEKLKNYFFWEENTRDEWLKKIESDKDAKLEVTYTSDGGIKQIPIKDLADELRIYLNSNPEEGALDKWWNDEAEYNGPLDFDIMTIPYPITKKSVDLGFNIYYRGAQTKINIYAFTKLMKVEVPPEVSHWHNPIWDNDIDNGLGGPLALSKKLTEAGGVYAWYSAINDPSVQEKYPLTYWYAGVERPYGAGPYYLFASDPETDDEFDADNFWDDDLGAYVDRESGDTYAGDSTYAKGVQKYLNNSAKGKETSTNVTIRHFITVFTDWADGTVFKPSYQAGITNWFDVKFGGAYGWTPYAYFQGVPAYHAYGVLPNGYLAYEATETKAPFRYDFRNFGPKVNQTKKAKVKVNWVNHD